MGELGAFDGSIVWEMELEKGPCGDPRREMHEELKRVAQGPVRVIRRAKFNLNLQYMYCNG